MGTYLNELWRQGDELTIIDTAPVLTALRGWEKEIGHICWCDEIDTYADDEGTIDVAAILSDYGWYLDAASDCGDLDYHAAQPPFEVFTWKGDKIGESWNAVLDAIALGVDPTKTTEIFCDMEGEIFAVRIHGGRAIELGVEMVVIEPSTHKEQP